MVRTRGKHYWHDRIPTKLKRDGDLILRLYHNNLKSIYNTWFGKFNIWLQRYAWLLRIKRILHTQKRNSAPLTTWWTRLIQSPLPKNFEASRSLIGSSQGGNINCWHVHIPPNLCTYIIVFNGIPGIMYSLRRAKKIYEYMYTQCI